MEQGGSSSNASNQRRMNFTDELTAIVMNSSQDFPVERDSRFRLIYKNKCKIIIRSVPPKP